MKIDAPLDVSSLNQIPRAAGVNFTWRCRMNRMTIVAVALLASCGDSAPILDCVAWETTLVCSGETELPGAARCVCASEVFSEDHVAAVNECGSESACSDVLSCMADRAEETAATNDEYLRCRDWQVRCEDPSRIGLCGGLNIIKRMHKRADFDSYLDCYDLACDDVVTCQQAIDDVALACLDQ